MTVRVVVFDRLEYVGESESDATSAGHQQQLRGHRYSGAFLRPDLHRLWILSLQTKVH